MPHKHTRRERDLSTYDLPPTQIARPLPVSRKQPESQKPVAGAKTKPAAVASKRPSAAAAASKSEAGQSAPKAKPAAAAAAATPTTALATAKKPAKGDAEGRGTKRKRSKTVAGAGRPKNDDAPRAFKRLMALASGKRIRSGLDDGRPKPSAKKARKAAKALEAAGEDDAADADAGASKPSAVSEPAAAAAALKIQPGERLSDFAARVDAALPLTGLSRGTSGGHHHDPLGLAKTFRTKTERKLHRRYDLWREEDARLRERAAEEQELAEEQAAELDEKLGLGVKWRVDAGLQGANKRKTAGGAGADADADLWAEFNRAKAKAAKASVPRVRAGIHDVVTAPPELTKINSAKYKLFQEKQEKQAAAREAAAAASEANELQRARAEIVAAYRKRAAQRRGSRVLR